MIAERIINSLRNLEIIEGVLEPMEVRQSIISARMYVRLFIIGAFMAGATLYVYQVGHISSGSPYIGQTMALVSLSLMNISVALNLRFPYDTAFQISTFSNTRLLYAYLWVILGTLLITETRLFQTLFHTVALTADQWLICAIPGIVLLIIGEIGKRFLKFGAGIHPAE